jgi:uncharacterized membrane protein YraQ (UPF0718 family)
LQILSLVVVLTSDLLLLVDMILEFLNNLWIVIESLGVWFLFGLLIASVMHEFIPADLFKR